MTPTQKRQRLRALLGGPACHSPASVHDPLAARIAAEAGFAIGLLSGSVVAATVLAAPDLLLHTASECAEQIRRVARATDLALLTDADNGYGNALNVMRTVEAFEAAGVAGMSVEDLAAPLAFGQPEDEHRLIGIDEAVGKLRAALAARGDASLVIAARTASLKHEGLAAAVTRAKAYAAAGVDALWTVTLDSVDELAALHDASGLPVIVGTEHAGIAPDALAAHGARFALQGLLPLRAAAKALREAFAHLAAGGAPEVLKRNVASADEMDRWLDAGHYRRALRDYLE
jgi:carboxyvinyl-carboxyphosphonate phosphorylmutase